VWPLNGTTRGGDSVTMRGWFGTSNSSRYYVRIAKAKIIDAAWQSSYELSFKTPAFPTGEATIEVSSAVSEAARSIACDASLPACPSASDAEPSDSESSSSATATPSARATAIEWFIADAPFRFIEPGQLPRIVVNALDPSRTLQIFDREASSANATCVFDGAILQPVETVVPSSRPGTSTEINCDVPTSLTDGWHTLVVLDDGIPTTFSFLVVSTSRLLRAPAFKPGGEYALTRFTFASQTSR